MTIKDYRNIQENILTNNIICDFAERMCKKGEVNPIEDYPQKYGSDVMYSPARRHMYTVRAMDLLRRMIILGATGLEVLRASEYLMVIIKSIDNKLDYKNCENALNIKELEKKYSRDTFFSLNIPISEIKYAIERDKRYFPVPVKVEEEETT